MATELEFASAGWSISTMPSALAQCLSNRPVEAGSRSVCVPAIHFGDSSHRTPPPFMGSRRSRSTMPRPYRPPRRPPLSSAEYQQRKQALRQYRCPFRDEPNGCKRESNSELCSFAHPDPGRPDGDGQLLDLPSYVCVFNLLNCCKKRTVQMARGPHTTDTIAVCSSSCFHLTTSELMNIEAFEIDHCALIASFFSADGTRECSICMERVYSKHIGFSRSFGILENCKHVYCAPCIIAWQAANSNKLVICPMCRVVSTKVAIRSQFTEDAVEKKAIFDRLKNVRSFV